MLPELSRHGIHCLCLLINILLLEVGHGIIAQIYIAQDSELIGQTPSIHGTTLFTRLAHIGPQGRIGRPPSIVEHWHWNISTRFGACLPGRL